MEYLGNELELFKLAKNWKRYFSGKIQKFISGEVLEVGAGVGATTEVLKNKEFKKWVCLEPDPTLCSEMKDFFSSNSLLNSSTILNGTLEDVSSKFDTILYIDVLEHIEDDSKEVHMAFERLNPNGNLIILVPAFNSLYSEFDKEIGHFRRYTKGMLFKLIPNGGNVQYFQYLDSLGFVASLANKFFLRQSNPKPSQIRFWDSFLVPVSKVLDKLFFYSFGKSLILVLKKSSD